MISFFLFGLIITVVFIVCIYILIQIINIYYNYDLIDNFYDYDSSTDYNSLPSINNSYEN